MIQVKVRDILCFAAFSNACAQGMVCYCSVVCIMLPLQWNVIAVQTRLSLFGCRGVLVPALLNSKEVLSN